MIDPDFIAEPARLALRQRLADPRPLLCVELRPPRRDLEGVHAMDAWIDVYHSVRELRDRDTVVFLTDNAVGVGEEENLSHLLRNLGPDANRQRVVPFLTLKHPLEYCHAFAARLRRESLPAVVVLGGDRHDGIPRCLPHACELRERLRAEQPALMLGGWANPYRGPVRQAELLERFAEGLDFVLLQVASHHALGPVEEFLGECERRGLGLPLIAGVFHFRSARRRTLEALEPFIPVPVTELERDFGPRGLNAEEVTAASLRGLTRLGLTRFYLSNLPVSGTARRLSRISRLAGLED